MASLFTPPYFDVGAGITPADGAKLYFNIVGSATPKDTYTTASAAVAHANPVVADSLGVFPQIFIAGDYDWILQDKNSVQQNTGSTSEFATVSDATTVKNFATLALAVSNINLSDGDTLNIAERTTGNGGGAVWDVVLSSTVTENAYNIVQGTGVATLSLVLRMDMHVNVKSGWAKGDGATDDSDAISAAIIAVTGKTLFFPSSTYELGSTKIHCDNPINIVCEQGVVFNQSGNVAMFEIDDTTDVTFNGNKCVFQHYRGAAGVNTFYIRGSERVKVEGIKFINSPKDQIYISNSVVTPANTSKDIIVKDCDFDGARRQGISVIVGERIHIEGNTFHDVTGESPQAGIDLETGTGELAEGLFISDVSIIGNKFYDITAQSGLYIATASNVTAQGNNFNNCLVGINATGVFVNTTEKTISAVANATDQFTVAAHSMSVGDLLFITTTDQGAGSGTIPTGATTGSTYRVDTVIDVNTLTFSTYYKSVPLSISDDGVLPMQVRAYRTDRLNNITIHGNTFKDMINQSVIADQATAMVIQGNVIDGGTPATASMLLSWVDDSIIDSNIIKNTTDGEGIFCSGIRTKVTNNLIIGSPDEGIRFYGGEASSIAKNTLIDCGLSAGAGMDVRYFNNGSISDNRVWDESGLGVVQGIDMHGTDCAGNIVSDNNLQNSATNNANSLLNLDRNNIINNANALDDGETYSAHLRANTANLTDIAHQVNDGDKYDGKQLQNTTTNIPMFAQGATPSAVWINAAGAGQITPVLPIGTHTGSSNSAVLTDSTKLWAINASSLVGATISNTTDGSTGVIISNTTNTITATMTGGADDDWDASDAYTIV